MFIPAYALPMGLIALSTVILALACIANPRRLTEAMRSPLIEISSAH